MLEKEINAITNVARETNTAAILFIVQTSEGEIIVQYDNLNSQTIVRFYSAFPINKSITRKSILNCITRKYGNLKKTPRIIIANGIAVVMRETTLSPIFGYRNHTATLVNFIDRNIHITLQYAKCGKEK